jgi:hypothetical protein
MARAAQRLISIGSALLTILTLTRVGLALVSTVVVWWAWPRAHGVAAVGVEY